MSSPIDSLRGILPRGYLITFREDADFVNRETVLRGSCYVIEGITLGGSARGKEHRHHDYYITNHAIGGRKTGEMFDMVRRARSEIAGRLVFDAPTVFDVRCTLVRTDDAEWLTKHRPAAERLEAWAYRWGLE